MTEPSEIEQKRRSFVRYRNHKTEGSGQTKHIRKYSISGEQFRNQDDLFVSLQHRTQPFEKARTRQKSNEAVQNWTIAFSIATHSSKSVELSDSS